MAQTEKRVSTMWETLVQSLGWEDPLEKEMAIHSSTIAWKIPTVHGVAKSRTRLSDFTFTFLRAKPCNGKFRSGEKKKNQQPSVFHGVYSKENTTNK